MLWQREKLRFVIELATDRRRLTGERTKPPKEAKCSLTRLVVDVSRTQDDRRGRRAHPRGRLAVSHGHPQDALGRGEGEPRETSQKSARSR